MKSNGDLVEEYLISYFSIIFKRVRNEEKVSKEGREKNNIEGV